MAQKRIEVEGLGVVLVVRRKGMRGFRLSVSASGIPRLSMPYYVPLSLGLAFINSKRDWIAAHAPRKNSYIHNAPIGKNHRLIISEGTAFKSRVTNLEIRITLPRSASDFNPKIENGINKALKMEAEALLPQRLETLSRIHQLPYSSAKIKKLKSRWGSCNSHKEISLSYYLIQLPWELIDYVIVHELAHTKQMNHQKPFWDLVSTLEPDFKQRRKAIRRYQPGIILN